MNESALRLLSNLLLAAIPPGAEAMTLRLCLPDISIQPYVSADAARPGLVERLLMDSARAVGIELDVQRQPPLRCRKSLEEGSVDVLPMVPATANLALAELPMRGDQVDAERRLARVQIVVVRRQGETMLQWDGQRFQPAQLQVGVRRGLQFYTQGLAPLGLTADDRALSGDQLLRKLAARRIDVALLSLGEFEMLQVTTPRALEALPKPFTQVDYYLGISLRRSAEQRARIEDWWTMLARMRELPAYQPPVQRVEPSR